jgi:catechol 2,3-dioxygenase
MVMRSPEAIVQTVRSPPDPEQLEAAGSAATAELSPQSTVGAVHLTVADLDRSVDYYTRAIGLRVLDRGGGRAIFGAGDATLLVLAEEPAVRGLGRQTGLYHFALLVPERPDLARWLAHAARDRVPLVGLSDHFVSEALYLSDPDGHGIEIYWDRPRAGWGGPGRADDDTPARCRRSSRRARRSPVRAIRRAARWDQDGHIHLKVAAIAETVAFYRDVIGFGLMAQLGGQAAFLSAGGYHHHVGANTWESAGARPPPPGTIGLRHATIVVPDASHQDRVLARVLHSGQTPTDTPDGPLIRDPSGNRLVIARA